ncbi:MAG: oxygenase MpaB family protein [Actinomycetota bacterium]
MDADAGLFGPGSVTWRLHADPMFGIAGLRALLLQALHPVAAQGVSDNSAFRSDPWGRFTRTSEYVAVTTFGTTAEALTMGARVQALHARMSTTDPTTGRGYPVDDPGLLAWVHNCLVESTLEVLERSGVDISAADADRYVAEQVRSAALVGLDAADVPHDRAALDAYFVQVRPLLRAGRVAREEASYVIAPPMRTRYALAGRPAWSSMAGLAFAALPPWARRLYSIPELPAAAGLHGAATTVALHALRASLRGVQAVVPPLRENPHHRSARERLAQGPDPTSQDRAEDAG